MRIFGAVCLVVGAASLGRAQDVGSNPSLRGVVTADKNEKWPPLDAKGEYLCKMPGQSPCPREPVVCTLLFCDCSTMGNCKAYDRPADWGSSNSSAAPSTATNGSKSVDSTGSIGSVTNLAVTQGADSSASSLQGVVNADKNEKWPPLDGKGGYLCKMPGQSPCPREPVVCTLLFCDCSTMGNCKWYDRPADWGANNGITPNTTTSNSNSLPSSSSGSITNANLGSLSNSNSSSNSSTTTTTTTTATNDTSPVPATTNVTKIASP